MAKGKEVEEDEGGEAAAGGGKKKLIIIGGAVAVVLIGGGVAAMLLLGGKSAEEGSAPADPHAKKEAKKGAEKGGGGEKAGEMGPVFMVKDMVINLVSEGGSRFCKIGVGLELNNEKMEPEMTKREALVKDILITVISKKTPEELMTPKGQAAVKQEVMDAVNDTLKDGRVTNVYFTMFLIQ